MAHKKAGGSTANIRDSNAQRLGVKLFAGQYAQGGAIIVRQRGTKIRPGYNVGIGRDDTLYAKITGTVKFRTTKQKRFDRSTQVVTYADVLPPKQL